MTVLVTGGGGFLGRAIVERLLARGERVRSFARGPYPELATRGVDVRQGDLTDAAAVAAAVYGCDVVFHVAARPGVWGRYQDFYRPNVLGTRHVLDACRAGGVRRLVYTSSPSVVFDGRDMEGVDERVPYPAHYEAHYPKTKAIAERLVLAANGPDLATVALRPHLIWGPGDNHLVPRILARGRAGALLGFRGPPKLVDSVYIDNAADAHLLAADRLQPGCAIGGKAYFISNGEPWPLWDLVDRILQAGRLPPVRRAISPRLAYGLGWLIELIATVLRSEAEPRMTRFVARELATAHWFDLSAARRDLGYEPRVGVEEGLRRLAASLANQSPDLDGRRRSLAIRSVSELRQEIERLNDARRQGHLKAVGNWSLGQCCQHLGRWIEFSFDGFPFQYPWHWRILGRLAGTVSWRWLVAMALRPGFRNPPSARAVEPDARIADDSGVQYLLQQISRIEGGGRMVQPSPVEGPITHEQWCYFHLRHAELHLSFQMAVAAADNSNHQERGKQ